MGPGAPLRETGGVSTWRFDGAILGAGSTGGVRVVLGLWSSSPFGPFADAMVADPDGHRTLVVTRPEVADFIAQTYSFDAVVVEAVTARRSRSEVALDGGGLHVRARIGHRDHLGVALRLVPPPLVGSPAFARAISPVAHALTGVRTWGTAGNGRQEAYGARDRRTVTALTGTWQGVDLGAVADVEPPVAFGFSSTPARPGITLVTTTVSVPGVA